MSVALIGGLIGLVVGFSGWFVLRQIADRIEQTNPKGTGPDTARVLRLAAIGDLILMPLLGYILAPLVAG